MYVLYTSIVSDCLNVIENDVYLHKRVGGGK